MLKRVDLRWGIIAIITLGTRLGILIFLTGWVFSNIAHTFATGRPGLAIFRALPNSGKLTTA